MLLKMEKMKTTSTTTMMMGRRSRLRRCCINGGGGDEEDYEYLYRSMPTGTGPWPLLIKRHCGESNQ